MDSKITFQKQNIPFEAEPNVAEPHVEISDGNVILSFAAKNSANDVELIFIETLMYRIGSPNDEGFYAFGSDPRIKNDTIYSRQNFPTLEFGNFYQVSGVDWKGDLLGNRTQVLDEKYKENEGFSHYVFFMKDGTFECVAKSWKVE